MRTNTTSLATLQAELDRLKAQIAQVGFVRSGSVVRRYMPCGKPGCRCQADPPKPHGPYWQYSHKVAGKTITRRLTPDQARLYQQWIANRRRIHQLSWPAWNRCRAKPRRSCYPTPPPPPPNRLTRPAAPDRQRRLFPGEVASGAAITPGAVESRLMAGAS